MINKSQIVFATNNVNKLRELREIVGNLFDIKSLDDIGCTEEIPETASSIEGNALMKARYVSRKYSVDCFADDTGLEVKALNGEPGVRTARYASDDGHDSAANVRLLLDNMDGIDDRTARFVTSIALIVGGKEYLMTGICPGKIALKPEGVDGFGYDPVFIPDGTDKTFAMMTHEEKNALSHRGKATRQLIEKLKNI